MSKRFRFYIDDSGSPNPDHVRKIGVAQGPDFFALGGILIDEDDLPSAKNLVAEFKARWPQIGSSPLHSYEIRNGTKNFRWLGQLANKERSRFFSELGRLMVDLPYFAHASVIDRPGYNARYAQLYAENRWSMCRTAFTIAVERAAKFARHHNAKLRVYVERSSKTQEALLKTYYEGMRSEGLPFRDGGAEQYAPMTAQELRETLFEFQVKPKASELMQIADLALWPLCQGGYSPEHRSYKKMKEHRKLLDAACHDGKGLFGVKYSCFDAA